ncbi:hypothetical protein EV421DRAFT_1739212 [Armillaria borealis]|uniref:Uncharacterized protein n=1 Tax=Armillaria borealis TaxID=47425 RepID=A0AA39J7C1_9AGAR|nr:hypothetical protein EV421DRAFT_1739212 [Armillaria borealis]
MEEEPGSQSKPLEHGDGQPVHHERHSTPPNDVAPPPPASPKPLVPPPNPKSSSSEASKLPTIPENKKGWLKGLALEFLETKHLPHFLELNEDAPALAHEYSDTACNNLHLHFDFRLPMNVVPEQPYDPMEVLLTADQLLKTAVVARDHISILNWMRKEANKVRVTKKAKGVSTKNPGNPMDLLLGRLNGVEPGSLKGTAPYQLWAKEEGETEREAFRVAFKEHGEPSRLHAGQEVVHLSLLFAQLPCEVQDVYKTQVAEEKGKALEERARLKALLDEPLPPREAQEMIDRFGQLMSPFLDQVAKLTGMKIFMVMGGAEPRRDAEDEKARSLSGPDETVTDSQGPRVIPFRVVDFTNGLLRFEDEEASEEELEVEQPPQKHSRKGKTMQNGASEKPKLSKRKRGGEEGDGSPKKRKKTKSGGGPSQGAFTESSGAPRGKKKAEGVSKKVAAGISKSLAKVIGRPKSPSRPVPPPVSQPPPSPQPPTSPSFLASEHPQMVCKVAGAHEDTDFKTLPTTPEARPCSPSKDQGSISFSRIPIFGPSDMPNLFEGSSVMLPAQRPKPFISPANAARLKEGKWPDWFEKARQTLLSPLLSSLAKAHLRLAEVGWWQKRKRQVNDRPELGRKDLRTLGNAWWTWWKALQPKWHGVADVVGPLEVRHMTGEGDWGLLWHPGANGLMTVLICLQWWGELTTEHYGMGSIQMLAWESAVEDVLWVLGNNFARRLRHIVVWQPRGSAAHRGILDSVETTDLAYGWCGNKKMSINSRFGIWLVLRQKNGHKCMLNSVETADLAYGSCGDR